MNIIGPLAKLAGTFMDNRQKKAEAKNNLEIAKLEAKTKAARGCIMGRFSLAKFGQLMER